MVRPTTPSSRVTTTTETVNGARRTASGRAPDRRAAHSSREAPGAGSDGAGLTPPPGTGGTTGRAGSAAGDDRGRGPASITAAVAAGSAPRPSAAPDAPRSVMSPPGPRPAPSTENHAGRTPSGPVIDRTFAGGYEAGSGRPTAVDGPGDEGPGQARHGHGRPAPVRHRHATGQHVVPGGLDLVEDAAVERERAADAGPRHRLEHRDAGLRAAVGPARVGDEVGQRPSHPRVGPAGPPAPREQLAVHAEGGQLVAGQVDPAA